MDSTAPDEMLEAGAVIGRNFRIETLLGVGGMGQVYRAEQISLGKKVAIKVLHRHLATDPALAKRFHREAKSASQLNHPNSVQIIDFGVDESGALFIAMELLEGRDLGKIIRTDFPFPLTRIVRIMGQVLAALDEAHEKGVIHRDLKPENIMVMDRRGEPDSVKVCDFGIAKIQDPKSDTPDSVVTMAGVVCGTPEYMSPEQARGEKLDGRTDLYSVACILYQMATGELPFTAETALGVVTRHLTESPIPPRQRRPDLDIDPAFEALILRGLAKDRALRPASALEFKRELERLVETAPGAREPVGTPLPESAAALGTAPTVAAIRSQGEADAPSRGGATRIATIAIVGALAVAGVAVALIVGRLRPPASPAPANGSGSVALAPAPAPPVGAASADAGTRRATAAATSAEARLDASASLARDSREDRPRPDGARADSATHPRGGADPALASEVGSGGGRQAASGARGPGGPRGGAATGAGSPAAGGAAGARGGAAAGAGSTAARGAAGARGGAAAAGSGAAERAASPDGRSGGGGESDAKTTVVRGFKEVLAEAEAALNAGEVQSAIRLFEEARSKGPRHPRVHRALGKLYMEKGRLAEARQAYERYLELQPDAPDAVVVRSILARLKK